MTKTAIYLYNTLTRSKEMFVPIDANDVRMYACGPTVYDYAHIGNARPIIVFDVLFRLLRHVYGADHVTYVRNITDLDDKINARAAEEYPGVPLNSAIRKLTERTVAQFHEDIDALDALKPTIEPRATDHIEEMKDIIEVLVDKGHAYVAEDHVLFSVPSMPDYGKLSRRSLEEMEAGARVDVAPYKRDPMDFVLWKPSGDDAPGWDSPAGIARKGRPGWHIECSAMAFRHLDEVFDIHAGGIDLVFPHHENEMSQSCCAHGTDRMANIWMHNGFLQVEGEKMSKSLGNFITIHDLLAEWPGEAIRLAMLATHYRQPINWTVKGLAEAKKTLDGWYEITATATEQVDDVDPQMIAALADDLNTPRAITVLHDLRTRSSRGDLAAARRLKASARFLGLLQLWPEEWSAWRPASLKIDEAQIESLITARNEARKAKDFAEADRIRDALLSQGIALKDGPDGTTWEVAV